MSDGVGGITEMTGRKPLIEHELIMLRFHGSLPVVLEPLLLWSGKNMQHNNIAKSGNVEKFHSMLWWAQVNPKTWLLVGDAMMSSRLRLIRTETEVQSEKGLATSSVTLQQSPALFDITYYDCESTWALLQRLLSWLSQAMTVTWWLFALGVMEYDAYLPILLILLIFFASIW